MLPSSRFNLHLSSRLFCQFTTIEMPSLIRNENIACENSGSQATRKKMVQQKKRCSVGTLYCTHYPNFSMKSQKDLSFAKMHSAPKLDVTCKCKLYYQWFPGLHALRQNRNIQQGKQIRSGTKDEDREHIVGVVEDQRLREELRSCLHFLDDSKLERRRHKVFNYAVQTLNGTIVNYKLDYFFSHLNCAAKENLALSFF